MIGILMVTAGAVLGGPARYLVDRWIQSSIATNHPRRIPIGTLTVNVIGSAVLGVASATLAGPAYLFVGIGFCGSFTTFSTFAALSEESLREGWPAVAVANAAASVGLCFVAFWLTHSLAA